MKNLKKSILILSLFAAANIFAQTAPDVQFETNSDSTAIEDVSYEYLLAHRVHLREKPSLKSKRLAVLNIGSKLSLWEKSANYEELNGIRSNWYRARVGDAEGWIWGGMIAQKTFGSEANYDVKFAYGLESVRVNEEGVLEKNHQLRAFKNGRQIDKIVFDGHEAIPMEIKNIGNKGLFNVEDILTLQIPSLEHGSSIGEMYIFWNNGKFTNVASLIDYADTTYAKSESFVFPSDMEGLKSTIVLETTITDFNKVKDEEIVKGSKKLVVSFYTWDGYKLVQKETLPTISKDLAFNTNE
ncbi:SH3 domain-containing protein [Maribacter algarum]|uniref:SH3 domain-containing protein n=1 Tax=Maribacter algarum (ex Zhang et al. 2020) TaxID=2578118 RepID=A0A5S3PPF8_9FLAO|nr:SH3 domain-containing protein [Maribacter algarum]TMM56626.1 SH3 domain-containing protein [Maribacter algarum]